MKRWKRAKGVSAAGLDLIFALKTQVFSAYLGRVGNKTSQRTFSGTHAIKIRSHMRRIVVRTVGFSGVWRGSCQSLSQEASKDDTGEKRRR